jgi:hypothetical protein
LQSFFVALILDVNIITFKQSELDNGKYQPQTHFSTNQILNAIKSADAIALISLLPFGLSFVCFMGLLTKKFVAARAYFD